MAFNPDDFQFERILPPEEKKPILEWDALHRLMVVRVKEQEEWVYLTTKLSAQVNQNLHDNLPDEWSNENDRIVSFSIYEDGDYIFEKEKLKFNFATKSSKWVRYEYNELSYGQIQELFGIMKAALAVHRVDTEIAKSKAIIDVATSREYLVRIDEQNKDIMNRLLRGSDWSQLPDSTETFPDELQLWTKYRSYIRDNVKTAADFENLLDYLIYDQEFSWPIDPFRYHELDPNHTVEYLTDPAHFNKVLEGTGTYANETIIGNVSEAALLAKKRQEEGGLPLNKQIWDKIVQYNLNEGLTHAVIENLNITGG